MSSDICPAGVPLNKLLPFSFAVDVMCVSCVLSYEIRKKKMLFTQMQLIWNSPLQVCALESRQKDVKKNEGKQTEETEEEVAQASCPVEPPCSLQLVSLSVKLSL